MEVRLYRVQVLLLIVSSLFFYAFGCIITGHAVRPNYTLQIQPLDLYTGFTLENCFRLCKEDTRCISFNYAEDSGRCEILDLNHCKADQAFLQEDGCSHFTMICLPDNQNAHQLSTHCLHTSLCTDECNEIHIESTSARVGTTMCSHDGECLTKMECNVNVCRCIDGYMLGSNGTCVQDFGHIGTEFVLAFAENGLWVSSSEELVLLVSSYSPTNVSLHVTSPAMPTNISKILLPWECTKILLPDLRVTTDGQLESRGIRLIASGRVSVAAVNGKSRGTDAFDVVPVYYASTEYRVVCPPNLFNNMMQLLIVSTENANTISFTTPAISTFSALLNSSMYGPNETFTVTFDALDTYCIQSLSDFSGLLIKGAKPFLVTVGSPIIGIQVQYGQDNLEASMAGINTLGRSHVIFSSPSDIRKSKTYKVLSVEFNTNIQILKGNYSKNISVSLGSPGTSFEFQLMDSIGSVISDKPIVVVGYLESMRTFDSGDPSSVIFPSLEQFAPLDLRFQTILRPELSFSSLHYITLTIQKQFMSGLLLDGINIAMYRAVWRTVPGLEHYTATSIRVSHQSHVLSHVTGHPAVLAVYYGFSTDESYAYVIGRTYRKLN